MLRNAGERERRQFTANTSQILSDKLRWVEEYVCVGGDEGACGLEGRMRVGVDGGVHVVADI